MIFFTIKLKLAELPHDVQCKLLLVFSNILISFNKNLVAANRDIYDLNPPTIDV